MLVEWFRESLDRWFQALSTIPLNDKDARDHAVYTIALIKQLETDLKEYAATGDAAYARLKELQEEKKDEQLYRKVAEREQVIP